MKLHTDRVDIERSNVGTETEFTIKTTAKAFDILSTGLYTDNIMAIVRELSCNAYDAHVDASRQDVPFEIHLPNRLEPFFSVKDFGTGLSDNQVMSLYTTYFDSTKTESNDFIGALGLGSKSPFSYTKSFEVISRFDSLRRVYSVFINEQGVPTIVQMGDAMPTDEHNGLEVKIAVEADDFYKFKDRAAHALRWFPTKPDVVGHPGFDFEKPPATDVAGEDWYMYKGAYYDRGRAYAVQGNVEYRVDLTKIEEIPNATMTFLKQSSLIMFFDIGDLEVAASREEIRYDNRTKEALLAKVTTIHESALRTVEERVKDIDSNWELIKYLDEMAHTTFHDKSTFRSFLAPSEDPKIVFYRKSNSRIDVEKPDGHDIYEYKWGRYGNNLSRVKGYTFEPREDTYVFINDLKTGGITRITQWMKNKGGNRVIIITPHKNPVRITLKKAKGVDDIKLEKAMNASMVTKAKNKLLKELGDPEVYYASLDTEPVRRTNVARHRAIFQYVDYHHNDYRPDTIEFARPEEFDFDAGGLYFDLERKTKVKYRERHIDWSVSEVQNNFERIIDIIKDFQGDDFEGWTTDDLYGVGSLEVKKFTKSDKWFNVFDLFLDAIDDYKVAVESAERWSNTPDTLSFKAAVTHPFMQKRVAALGEDSEFRKVFMKYAEGQKAHSKNVLDHTFFVARFDRFYGNKVLVEVDNTPYVGDTDLTTTYPMLEFFGNFDRYGLRESQLDKVFDYIAMIDDRS